MAGIHVGFPFVKCGKSWQSQQAMNTTSMFCKCLRGFWPGVDNRRGFWATPEVLQESRHASTHVLSASMRTKEISLQHLKILLDSPWTMFWIYCCVSSAPCEHWTCQKEYACEWNFRIIEAWQGAVSGKHSEFIRSSSQVSPIGCMFCAHGNIVCKQLYAAFIAYICGCILHIIQNYIYFHFF